MVLIVVNSAIAGGKSTLIEKIEENIKEINGKKVFCIKEPIELLTNINGENMLDLFYKDMKRWSFTVQFSFFIFRIDNILKTMEENGKDNIFIMERCWFIDRKCFAENLHNNGSINEVEWYTYNHIFDLLMERANIPKIDAYIFIENTLETHMKRMYIRGRPEEKDITEEYQQNLIQKHNDMIKEINGDTPLLKLDGEKDFLNNGPEQKETLMKINSFIQEILK